MKGRLAVFIVLCILLLTMVPGCGGNNGEKTSAPTPVITLTTSSTPTPSGPVKIGAIQAWSGPMAMAGVLADQNIALVEDQVKDIGGILGGRLVKFVRGDDAGTIAQTIAQARKLILDDKVTMLTLGGESAAQFTATSDVAEELKVPYLAMSVIYGMATKKYCAYLYGAEAVASRIANFISDYLKPKTVAFLLYDAQDSHTTLGGIADEGVAGVRDRLKAKGIEIIYEQFYPLGTTDFTPYLTKIKYLNPDVVVTNLNDTGQAITINKQIMELGGWGSMRYFSATEAGSAKAAVTQPSAAGTYVSVLWLPGSDEPGMKAFENAFQKKYGRLPTPELTYYYNSFWTAIKAIELAGSDDPVKIAEAMRSGNLEWDSAWGPLHIGTDGIGQVNMMVSQVQEGGKLVNVWP